MPVTNYFWDPVEDNVVTECDDTGATLARYTTEPERFGNLISQEREGVKRYYHFDGQGSTLALTNTDGDVTDAYTYNAFGEMTATSGSSANSRRYVGERGYEYEAETDAYYVRARTYEPQCGRWLSVDPLWLQGRVVDLYCYVSNQPVLRIDPAGLQAHGCTKCWPHGPKMTPIETRLTYTCVEEDGADCGLVQCNFTGTESRRFRCYDVCQGRFTKRLCKLRCGFTLVYFADPGGNPPALTARGEFEVGLNGEGRALSLCRRLHRQEHFFERPAAESGGTGEATRRTTITAGRRIPTDASGGLIWPNDLAPACTGCP